MRAYGHGAELDALESLDVLDELLDRQEHVRSPGGVRMKRQREYEPLFFAVEVVCGGGRISRCTFSSRVQLDREWRTLTEVRLPELERHVGIHIAMRSMGSLLGRGGKKGARRGAGSQKRAEETSQSSVYQGGKARPSLP